MNIRINLFSYLPIWYEYCVLALLRDKVCYSRAIINIDMSSFVCITPRFFRLFSLISKVFINIQENSN